MNTIISNVYRSFVCLSAAMAISLVISLSFVRATAVPPGSHLTPSQMALHF
jgi:hypothetical protein